MESAPDPGLEQVPLSGSLNPKAVGQRVVVRSIVPGEAGPTGGPAFTDVLGVLEKWADGVLSIRSADGAVVEIPQGLVVSGKPVPPRPTRFSRFSDEEVERRCTAFSRFVEVHELGTWQIRLTGGNNPLANTVLALDDPGIPLDEALDVVADFYARHDRRPAIRFVAGSPIEHQLLDRGWSVLEPDNEIQLSGVAALARKLAQIDIADVVYEDQLTHEWLVGNERAQANFDVVAASLDLEEIAFGSIHENGQQVARGRVNIVDGWAFFADLMVPAQHRRRGLAIRMIAGLTEWAAERGASVMALQVRSDNEPAQALYANLGFEHHHTYRYLASRNRVDS